MTHAIRFALWKIVRKKAVIFMMTSTIAAMIMQMVIAMAPA